MIISRATRRQNASPRVLNVIQDERHELDFASAALGAVCIAHRLLGSRRNGSACEQPDEVHLEDEAQDHQHQKPANPDVKAAEPAAAETETSTAAFIAPVFNVATYAAGCPPHNVSLTSEQAR